VTTLAASNTAAEHTQTLVAIIVGVIAIMSTMLAGVRYLAKRYLEPNRQMVEEWNGDPGQPKKGIQPRPGALERITTLEAAMTTVKGAVTKNGGSSMADAVTRIDAAISQGGAP
jgi:hypothetical protein